MMVERNDIDSKHQSWSQWWKEWTHVDEIQTDKIKTKAW